MESVVKAARSEQKPLKINGRFLITPFWDNFISHFNYQYNNKDYPHAIKVGNNTKIVNGTLLKSSFYVSAFKATEYHYPQLKYVIETLEGWYGSSHDNAFALMNFVGGEPPIQVHMDRRDSFYWQCIGSSTWEFYESADSASPYMLWKLNPGDAVFVPEGVFHSIVAPEPRAAISICFNSKTVF